MSSCETIEFSLVLSSIFAQVTVVLDRNQRVVLERLGSETLLFEPSAFASNVVV
jgi:hypothetical protein